jgi:prophage regulatory protein
MNEPVAELAAHIQRIRILRLPQVCDVTGFCRSMIYLMEAEHRFPKRVKIGTRAVGWLEGDVQAWLANRIETSRTQAASLAEVTRARSTA